MNSKISKLYGIMRLLPVLLISPAGLHAANHPDSDNSLAMLGSESMYFEDMPVIISATRLSQPLNESPVSTTIIDRQMIDASGAQTIPDLLRLVPGFTVGYLNGNTPVAAYHGQSTRLSRRIQLVIDGRSVYLPTLAGVSWSDLVVTLDDIERVEVSRGPNASTYGNNAFLAVVSITTKHASEDKGTYIKGTVGAHDTADAILRFGGQSGDLDYRVSVGTKNNAGTDLLNDFTETDYFSYRMDYQLDLQTQLYYSGGVQTSEYGAVKENAADIDNDVGVTTAFQNIRLEKTYDGGNSLTLQYYYNYTKSLAAEPPVTVSLSALSPIFAGIDDFSVAQKLMLESERHDLELSYHYNPLHALRLVSGTSIRVDKVNAQNVFDPNTDNSLNLFRAFTHGEYRLTDDFLMNAGVMLEHNGISGIDVSPRLAFIYHLTPQHSFRLSASQATRTPTIFEENGYIAVQQQLTQNGGQPLTNPLVRGALNGDILNDTVVFTSGGLNSEEITSYELGYMANLLDNKLRLDIKLFSDISTMLIDPINYVGDVPNENVAALLGASYAGIGAYDAVNASSTETQGIEFYTDYRVSNTWRFYTYLAYVELKARNTNTNINPDDANGIVGRLEESSPKRSFGAMIMKQWPNDLNTSLSIYRVGDMDWLDRTHSRTNSALAYRDRSAEGYTKIDLVLRKSHKVSRGRIDYSLILQNLAGSYADYTRSNYTDPAQQNIDVPGSIQDQRGYFELAFMFN